MLLDRFLSAIETGEVLKVRYFGGSMPGAERQLRPISISDGKLRALCFQSGETKTFVIEKMEEVVAGVPSAMAAALPSVPSTFPSVRDFAAHYSSAFEELGWVVQFEENSISLHRTFKNGKLINTSDVELSYESMTSDLVFDGEQIIETNTRERSRPWILRGKNKTTKTFADLGKAQLSFLEFAEQLAPSGGK